MMYLRLLSIPLLGLALTACQVTPPRPSPDVDATARDAAQPVASTVASKPAAPRPTFLLPEPAPPRTGAEVLQRLRERLVDPPCVADPLVRQWQDTYARSPAGFARQIEQALPLIGLTLEGLDRYRLPGEYALLPFVESGYRPDARGAGDHLGLWQFGRSTAEHFDLPLGPSFDARLDPLASTEAALRYLGDMHNQFGDWKLAVLGFNAGPYRLKKQLENLPEVRFSADARMPPGLPPSSYAHVAKMKALACLLAKPERFDLDLPADVPIEPLVRIQLPDGQSSLEAIARDRELPPGLLEWLNPGFRDGYIARNAPRHLLLPESLSPRFEQFELPPAPPPKPSALFGERYIVRSGDTLGAIARRHGIRLTTLMSLNSLDGRSILRPGQRLKLAP